MIEDLKKKFSEGICTVRRQFLAASKKLIKAERTKDQDATGQLAIFQAKCKKVTNNVELPDYIPH
jgi:SET domain-containing protein